MELYCEMTDEELSKVDLVDFTGLSIGDRVMHRNEGKHGGNSSRINYGLGTVVGHTLQGLTVWGGLCVTVKVLWDNGEKVEMIYSLAIKQ